MNIIAIDIGNTNINIGLFLDGEEQYIKTVPGQNEKELTEVLETAWKQVLGAKDSENKKVKGTIVVSSVKPTWTEVIRKIVGAGERAKDTGHRQGGTAADACIWVDEPAKVGTDRVVAAAAAYAVVEDAVVVADFGTAVTIDLVDEHGVFQGGVIFPGFELSTMALNEHTAQLPKVKVTKPEEPYGKNTN